MRGIIKLTRRMSPFIKDPQISTSEVPHGKDALPLIARGTYNEPAVAAVFCVLFGVTFMLNTHPIGDGLWFWYATAVRNGQHLYSDLHLNLQPLFVLLTAGGQELFGRGWLASKIVPALQLIAYCTGLFLISKRLPWKSTQVALLLMAAFFLTMAVPYYRIDDYHITTHCFELYAIYLLLRLHENRREYVASGVAILLGVLSGWSIGNRLNDGAGLVAGCLFTLPFFLRSRRFLNLSLYFLSTVLALYLLIRLTGDTVHVWALESVFRASKIKGGTGNILTYPFTFPFRALSLFMEDTDNASALTLTALVLLVFSPFAFFTEMLNARRRVATFTCAVVALALSYRLYKMLLVNAKQNIAVSQLAVPLIYLLAVLLVVRLYRALRGNRPAGWSELELLIFIPFWQMLGGAMTGGSGLPEFTPAVAMVLLLIPISLPFEIKEGWPRRTLLVLVGFVALSGFGGKVLHPYFWHHFNSDRMFKRRVWYRSPTLGPMYLERMQLRTLQPICAAVAQSAHPDQLLSLPYPYPNYFCDVSPWHGYVQTWYDTSSQSRIDDLMGELATAPPEWIVYQRALDSMKAHEAVFLRNKPLPHRALDRMIQQKLATNQWSITYQKCYLTADWLLIHTAPAGVGNHQALLEQTDKQPCESNDPDDPMASK